jgi:Zn-dependent protease
MSSFSFHAALLSLPGIILGLTVHEFMHGWTADRCGDPTARMQGRLTFNPLKHIDPLGFVFLIFAGFGWAKPVMFNRELLRNPRRDEALIAVAGPFANLVLAFLMILLLRVLILAAVPLPGGSTHYIGELILYTAYINLGLFVFNLIPLPPLDGYHVVFQALKIPQDIEFKFVKFGGIALFAILIIDAQMKLNMLPIGKAVAFIAKGMMVLTGF